MTTLQRLLSNTLLAFASNVIVRVSNSLLFIVLAHSLGPTEAGRFNLGITYFTVIFALSAWGLHELLVREVAIRTEESGRYIVNYLVIRLTLATTVYLLFLAALRFILPYGEETSAVLRILALAVFPEAIFNMIQALFEAHERLLAPMLAATVNSAIKLGGGLLLLNSGLPLQQVVWIVPVGSAASLLVLVPFLMQLFWRTPQRFAARFDRLFSWSQIKKTSSFVVIHLFSLLDFQTDAFLISILLSETAVGWYGAAQTILLAFWMLPTAVRAALYPLMARYHQDSPTKLAVLYRKSLQYLVILGLPMAAGVFLLAPNIVPLVFGPSFDPAIPALQWSIWAFVFALLTVPNARLLLVDHKQRHAAWLIGIGMIANVSLNLLLIPRFGIVGAAMARTGASLALFLAIYVYAQRFILKQSLHPAVLRPLLATALMMLVVWQMQGMNMVLLVVAGVATYVTASAVLRVIPSEDWQYWRNIYKSSLAVNLSSDVDDVSKVSTGEQTR